MKQRYQYKLPQKSDYPNNFKILDQPGLSAEYHQLLEASASAYFETKGPAKWLFMKRFQMAKKYLEKVGPVKQLLDAGTGIGFFLPTLAQSATHVWAVDYAQHTLKYAKAMCKKLKIKNVDFKQGDLMKLPFKEKQFDVVIALSILEHIFPKNLPKAIRHFKRVLKPNGYLIAGYPNEGSNFFKFFQQLEKGLLRPNIFKSLKNEKRNYKPLGHVALSWQIDRAINQNLKIIESMALPLKALRFYSLSLSQKS